MKYTELAVLLPCHSLEDFPLYHKGDDADSLLACWTALWHPALVAAVGAGPKWHRVDLPPEDLTGKLLLVPTVSVSQLPTGFGQRAKEAGAILIRKETDRRVIVQKALEQLDGGDAGIDGELTADFLALGFAYLHVQILTRQLRYASNLDEVQFFNQLVAGAQAAATGNVGEARGKLEVCFNQLAEERDHYYSVDAYLIDLTLVAETTMGETLRQEIQCTVDSPINLLLGGDTLAALADREPQSLAAVQDALRANRLGLVGGEQTEAPLPLLPCENILAELQRGQATAERILGRRFDVFGRRRFGLTPLLPGVLEKLQFRGALHATLDEGTFPAAAQAKTRWQGLDTGVIDALAKPPLDASQSATFLNFAQKLGESMDADHVATLCLAHWPGQTSPWYDDLRRCARYTPALGKFTTVENYFANTYQPGQLDCFESEQYRSPYLKQAVIRRQPDPLSSITRIWSERIARDAHQGLSTMTSCVRGKLGSNGTTNFLEALPKQASQQPIGLLIANPFGISRRVGFDISSLPGLPVVSAPVVAAGEANGQRHAVVDLPPMGYVWLAAPIDSAPASAASGPALVEDDRTRSGAYILRNEFFEATVDPVTGALKTLKDYQARGNRLSLQLALRMPGERAEPGTTWRDPDATATYSVMAADDVAITAASAALGELTVRGRLVDLAGQTLATFVQTLRVWRGSRVLQLDVEIDPKTELTSDPWNSYFTCRVAWADDEAKLFANLHETRQPVTKSRFEAPLFVDIESDSRRTSLLTGGLPFHRRVGSRMLDALLIVRGERQRRFQLGIGVDLPYTLPEALNLLAPHSISTPSPSDPCHSVQSHSAPSPTHSWLFHVDSRTVFATHWSPIVNDGRVVGVRARLLETAGKAGRGRLSAFRPFVAARTQNFATSELSAQSVQERVFQECAISDGRVALDFATYEWIEVEARWS